MAETYGELVRSSESMLKAKEFFEIRIPKELFEYSKPEVFIYALDSNTIGISPTESEFWDKKSLWKGEAELEDCGDYLLLVLPYHVASFYKNLNSAYKVSAYKSGRIHIFFGEGGGIED
jgi:hypothetical protein